MERGMLAAGTVALAGWDSRRKAGTSPHMIFWHYQELVRAMNAEEWFRITPARGGAAKSACESEAGGEDRDAANRGGGVTRLRC
jgi:hypothetical protein